MAPLSSDITARTLLHYLQYNNLRADLLNASTGHDHKTIGRAVARLCSGVATAKPSAACTAGDTYLATDTGIQWMHDGSDWLAIGPTEATILERVFKASGNYSCVATDFEDVPDATKTLVGYDGNFSATFSCSCSLSVKGKKVWFMMVRDDDALNGHIFCFTAPEADYLVPISAVHQFGYSSAASHTFKLQWKVEEGEATLYADGTDGTMDFSVLEQLC